MFRCGVARGGDDVARAVEPAEHLPEWRGEDPDAVKLEVGVVCGVVGAHAAHAVLRGPAHGGVAEHVRRGDVDDVRREGFHLMALALAERRRHLVLAAAGHGDVRDVGDVEPLRGRRLAEIRLHQVGGKDEHLRVAARLEVLRQALHRARDAVHVLPDGREDDHATLGAVPAGGAAVPDERTANRNGGRRRKRELFLRRRRFFGTGFFLAVVQIHQTRRSGDLGYGRRPCLLPRRRRVPSPESRVVPARVPSSEPRPGPAGNRLRRLLRRPFFSSPPGVII